MCNYDKKLAGTNRYSDDLLPNLKETIREIVGDIAYNLLFSWFVVTWGDELEEKDINLCRYRDDYLMDLVISDVVDRVKLVNTDLLNKDMEDGIFPQDMMFRGCNSTKYINVEVIEECKVSISKFLTGEQ